MKQIKLIIAVLLLLGFVALGITYTKNHSKKLELQKLELNSKESQLIELNVKYEKILDQKTDTEKQKEDQLKKIEELEKERERLQKELQAKRDKTESERLAKATRSVTAIGSVNARENTVKTLTGNKEAWLRAAGIAKSDWIYADYIVSKESSWNPNAYNAGSGACGLVQALPCSKLGKNWNDPVTALKWQKNYVTVRYGSYAQAYTFWRTYSWY